MIIPSICNIQHKSIQRLRLGEAALGTVATTDAAQSRFNGLANESNAIFHIKVSVR